MQSLQPVIIVEDDLDEQEMLMEIFKSFPVQYRLLFFVDGREVLEYLRTTTDKPFIIICDINIPKMSGLELRREIMNDEYLRLKSIPFIFLSTTGNKTAVNEAYALTVQGYFVKPLTFPELENKIHLIMRYWKECIHINS